MLNVCCLILAAGNGKRMLSDKPKVLSSVLFDSLIEWVISTVDSCKIKDICVVTGFMSELVEEHLNSLPYKYHSVIQKERKGTAHAVMTADSFLSKYLDSDVLILGSDSPFIDKKTILDSYKMHKNNNNSVTIVSVKLDEPYGYGRIIRDYKSDIVAIVEEKDANLQQKSIQEINSGVYWFKVNDLLNNLYDVSNNTAQGEFYLTSLIQLFIKENLKVNAYKAESNDIVLGANDCNQLKVLNEIARNKIIENFVSRGINIPFSDGVVIGRKVIIGQGTTILPGTILSGTTNIGKNCIIGPNSQIMDSTIGNNVRVNYSYCKNSTIENNKSVGPFETLVDKNNLFVAQI